MITRYEAEQKANKPLKGHKGKRRIGISYVCECGWSSSDWYGPGATSNAAGEFHYHKASMICEGA